MSQFLWPAEVFQLFDTQTTHFSVGATGARLARADSERIVLVIGLSAPPGALNLRVAATPTLTASSGIHVIDGQPLILTHVLHGPLPSLEWNAGGVVGAIEVDVIEVFLRRRPRITSE